MIRKLLLYLKIILCCHCTSCILSDEFSCEPFDATNYKERKNELEKRYK